VTESAVTEVCGKSVGARFRAGVSVRPMNTPAQTQLLRLLPLTLILSTAATAQPPPPDKLTTLGTADQREVETEAIEIFNSPTIQAQVAAAKRLFLASPVATSPESKASVDRAVKELAFAAVLDAVNGDPAHPKIVWGFTAPRKWLGHAVPGSRWGIDNPDNVYRFAPIDGVSKYELTIHPTSPGPVQFSFIVYDSFVGEGGRQGNLDTPVAALRDQDVVAHPDGSFTITIDSAPANGRVNHLQTSGQAKVLLIRNTFNDWGVQNPQAASIKRVAGPAAGVLAREQIVTRAVELIQAGTQTVLGWETKGFAAKSAPNTIAAPFARGGGWGFAANGNFRIASDEALVVTLDPVGARYVGFDLTDPWLVSRDHISSTGSLNNNQLQPNGDGTYTYVIAPEDPGVANWVDTGGLHEGKLLIRWQVLPASAQAEGAVREVKLVKVSELRAALPAGLKVVRPVQRLALRSVRAKEYAHRYTAVAADHERLAEAR
jgi:hypothetical protein